MKNLVGKTIIGTKKVVAELSNQANEVISNISDNMTEYEIEAELSDLYEKLGKLYVSVGSEDAEFITTFENIKKKEEILAEKKSKKENQEDNIDLEK